MSLAKSVPNGLNPRECKRTKLREPPPVPYIPEKDKVQEEVAKLRNLQIKTLMEKNTTLNFLVWHKNGTREAFLIHMTAVLDAVKKRGHFKDYDRAQKAHDEAKKVAESAEAGLALLDRTSAGTTIRFEKHCNLCKKHGGAYTTHNARDCRRFEKDGKEKSNFHTAKKGGKKGNPINHNFAQLTKKIEKLEKALKKSGKKGKKRRYKDSDSNSE
jgi:hypothetical protein